MGNKIVPFRIAAPADSTVAVAVEDPYNGLWAVPQASPSSPPTWAALAGADVPTAIAAAESARIPGLFTLDLPVADWRDGYYVAYIYVDGMLDRLHEFCVLGGSSQWQPVAVQMKGSANVNVTIQGRAGEVPAKAAFNAIMTYAAGS